MNKEDRKIFKECKKILRKHGCLRAYRRFIKHRTNDCLYDFFKWASVDPGIGVFWVIMGFCGKDVRFTKAKEDWIEYLEKNNIE